MTQVHEELWKILEASNAFTKAVKPQNRVKLNAGKGRGADPFKELIREADLPEVRITPVSMETNIHRSSSEVGVLFRWEIQVATGDRRLTPESFPLMWIILRALYNWGPKMRALTWRSNPFVVKSEPVEVLFGVTDEAVDRGIPGWTTVWSGLTDCSFKRSLFLT